MALIDLHARGKEKKKKTDPAVRIGDAKFPSPFETGLVYSSPARGTWTIAHTSMLIPGSHQIFVCPSCCLRGVVLSAEEMGAMDRFSMLEFTDDHILRGDLEELIIEGVSEILCEMDVLPTCVLLYTSCVQHFLNIDLHLVYRTLAEKFSEVDFIDCYMLPTMRAHFSPEKMQWRQLYRGLDTSLARDPRAVDLIGSYYEIDPESEIFDIFRRAEMTVRQLPTIGTYEEYKRMGEAAFCVYFNPIVSFAAEDLAKRLQMTPVFLPAVYETKQLLENEKRLADALGISGPLPDHRALAREADQALDRASSVLRDFDIAIDASAVTRPVSLAKKLFLHGFRIRVLYADAFSPEEKEDFEYLRVRVPEICILPMTDWRMRAAERKNPAGGRNVLAIGQKAAYYTGTKYFVNLVENGGLYGFTGLIKLAKEMTEGALHPKEPRELISEKALGCRDQCARMRHSLPANTGQA